MNNTKNEKELIQNLQQENEKLNKKIGNLFYIYNTISKMFEQLKVEQLAQLAVEAFANITDSKLTTLMMKNDITEAYEMVMYKCLTREKPPKELALFPVQNSNLYLPNYLDLTEESQRELLISQFHNGEELFRVLNPSYMISIKLGKDIKGFITISDRKESKAYDKDIIELIESMGKALTIVFNTERSFNKIRQEKNLINSKLKAITDLNEIVKVINSVTSIENLVSLIISSLSVNCRANLGFFALYNEDQMQLEIKGSINTKGNVDKIPVKGGLLPILLGEKIITAEEQKVSTIFEDCFIEDLEIKPTGAFVVPIYIEEFDVKLIGAIGILSMENGVIVTPENMTFIEYLANHVAPIIYHIKRVEEVKQQYHPDYYIQFLESLGKNIMGVDIFDLDLYVIWVSNEKRLKFSNDDIVGRIFGKLEDVFCVDNQNTLMMTTDYEDIAFVQNILCSNETIKTYKYKEDFNSKEDFVNLFSS